MPNSQITHEHDLVSIQEKVRFLQQPDSYPDKQNKIEAKETHMSWVFLGEEFVYKLKKPVRYDILNFSTIEARRKNCEREVRLNRRLAEDVYLETLPLTMHENGQLAMDGEGAIVDWLVKMRRLPLDRMLDAAILNNKVNSGDVTRFCRLLTNFYQHIAAPAAIEPDAYLYRFEQGISANHKDLCKTVYRMSLSQTQRLSDAQVRFIEEQGHLLKRRAKDGRIVEAHGDLRPEHICLMPEPVIIDCLEFDQQLRTQDPLDELAYLAMECERLGATLIGKRVLQHYFDATGDHPPEPLISFYKIYRACIRAKIALWHIDDDQLNDHEKWRAQAYQYLEVAERYMTKC
jgi:aminoglycoside phosphotransferase family enzyme